ncbi:AAA family ATPase [Microbacterium aerolatum]|uniref:AAA family ATPase n=1 Tax=Microbacterium aerolatum TaxID=153731 RepID=UPI0020015599|nr:AAA family ATPase [Microbacterium aerolatum]MCK3769396.1 AAA family ATPase [Microbacterium aerolatum]
MDYAVRGTCDSHLRSSGALALDAYSGVDEATVSRFIFESGAIKRDELDAEQLARWVDGCDPASGEHRGRQLDSPLADLVLDSTVNAPKSFSIVALLNPDLAVEFEALQDRLRDRIIATWQVELNARRGAGGRFRERLARIEVVELRHRRSRALDPHIHRHLWLGVKVRGLDGKWSNVDSRVAMRVQNLVNAEGDLAARTDPRWVAALARHGYTLDGDGEIAQLAHVVRPLSRRSNQIEANRAVQLARWRAVHPGLEPSHDVIQRIDRYAWAAGRPGKPRDLDEREWSQLVTDELTRLDPRVLNDRASVFAHRCDTEAVDRGLLARRAVVDADERSKSSNGRFSVLDVRAGATRAVAASGVAADRDALQSLIDEVTWRALAHTRDLLPDEPVKPAHVKALVTHEFAALKAQLGERLTRLSSEGWQITGDSREWADPHPLLRGSGLDPSQSAAAAAVVSAERLVTVTGPAGTGKTTLLRAARLVLEAERCRMLIVAPTRKAAAVASREVETAGTSVHALLADHGWRWRTDDAGAAVWWRLARGERDPSTGMIFRGPRHLRLGPGVRIVVDEAGMLDLHAADALTQLALETGAGVALVGDPHQASPVGHAGAMALAERRAGRTVELSGVHRFDDPMYAALTLCVRSPRSPEDAANVAAELQRTGHVQRVDDAMAARDALVEGYFLRQRQSRTVAIVTATNDEAALVNEAIQEQRVARGQLATDRIAVGSDEQRILEGDVVQTRRNDRAAGIENRAIWTVTRIGPVGLELQRMDDAGDVRTVTRDYAAEHIHLAYATTVHGIQGETTDTSLVGPGVDASGLYVGLTRGRRHNEAIVIASSDAGARKTIADEMMRGLPEPDIEDATRAAHRDFARAAHDDTTEPTPDSRSTGVLNRAASGAAGHPSWLTQLTEWILAARMALLEASVATAANESALHARPVDEVGRRTELAPEARAELEARIERYERLAAEIEESPAPVRTHTPDTRDAAHLVRVVTNGTPTGRGI